MKTYLVKEGKGKLVYSPARLLSSDSLGIVSSPVRQRILQLLSRKPMYPADVAKRLKLHEQKVYYHIRLLQNAGVIDVVERQEIRGTVAKKFAPKHMNFCISLSDDWHNVRKLFEEEQNRKFKDFMHPFIEDGDLNAHLIVGSPDAHGPHKARARDGHYAIDLSLFLGGFCDVPDRFSVKLDVDVKLENREKDNLILVGGPVTNILVAEINERLPTHFSDKKPWGIVSELSGNSYTEDTIGIIVKTKNPFNPDRSLLVIAGIRNIGTKAAVMALTRHTDDVLRGFSKNKDFSCIVQGFDLDGDGKIDSVEVLE